LKQLQFSAEIYEYERNINRAAKQLRLRILTVQGVDVPIRTCKSRIYAALNYFNIDNNVAIRVWKNDFADRYEDLAKMCIAANDYKSAGKWTQEAERCRTEASEASVRESESAPIFLITPEITAKQMGFTKKSLKKIATKHHEGFYYNLIDSLPIDKNEKKRLLSDADIQDVEIIEETLTDEY